MVSQNRILTVSYGTFSCTLEGFDDPFGTMKAIAEYFRDLAAEDRYFGAEPPQPDAAMLHRIAEREIQRRVEAKIQDNGVILRAADLLDSPLPVSRPQPVAEPVVAEPAPTVAQMSAPPAEPAPRLRAVDDGVAAKLARIRAAVDRSRAASLAMDDIEDAEIQPDPGLLDLDQADQLPEDFAEDLAWPDADLPPAALAGSGDVDPVTPEASPVASLAQTDAYDDEETSVLAAEIAAALVEDDHAADVAPPAESAVAERDEPPIIAAEILPVAEVESQEPVVVAADPEPAGVSAVAPRQGAGWHLRRRQRRLNREAAARASALAAPEPLVPEVPVDVSVLQDPAQAVDFDLDALEAALEGIEAEAAAEAAAAQQPEPDAPDLDVNAELSLPPEAEAEAEAEVGAQTSLVGSPDDVDMLIARLVPQDAAAVEPAPASEPAPRVRVVKVRRSRPIDDVTEEPAGGEPLADVSQEDVRVADEAQVLVTDAMAVPDLDDRGSVSADLAPPAPGAVAMAGVPDLGEPETDDDAVPTAAQDLTPVADLPAQPVRPSRPVPARPAVQRPMTQRPVAPRIDDAVPHTGAPVIPARPVRPERVADRRTAMEREIDRGEAAVDRLLRQADTEMAGADTRRRTSTIAHLKAAVAATVAERLVPRAPNAPTEPDVTAAYRSDLATAVRPRRPGEGTSEAPLAADPARVAPLVLVSAQRIDRPLAPSNPSHAAGARRSRSMAATALALDDTETDEDDAAAESPSNLFGGLSDFADWAQDAGMLDLADRLEAAGAWLMTAEGLEGFNRPQLMRLAAADEAAESREAAMAAFGALLRDGRIVKARRGMFTLPETSVALSKARKAAR